MRIRITQYRLLRLAASLIAACLTAASAHGQTARQVRGAAAVEPLTNEPPAKIVIDPPLADPLSHGRIVIQYRTENLHIAPVFGAAALPVSPRVGHIHVTVDDATWAWADASGEPVILNGLLPGPHRVLLQLETANHHELDRGVVQFTIPASVRPAPTHLAESGPAVTAATSGSAERPAKIIIGSPLPEPLSRGVVFVEYRTEHLHIVPVFGQAALAIAPRIGHIHVTVDDATWHWADASGNPVIIAGLSPGPHRILIQLVNTDHHPIDEGTIHVTVPPRGQ